jgi:hypothetical protein
MYKGLWYEKTKFDYLAEDSIRQQRIFTAKFFFKRLIISDIT